MSRLASLSQTAIIGALLSPVLCLLLQWVLVCCEGCYGLIQIGWSNLFGCNGC